MKNIKKITIASILLLVLLLSLLLLGNTISAQADAITPEELYISKQHDEKLISEVHTPNLDEDFSDDEVIVILKREYSNFNLEISTNKSKSVLAKLYKFENIERKEIEDLFPLQNHEAPEITYRKMLSLGLKTPGKEKVIEAIEYFQNIDVVLVAQPKYNYDVNNDWIPSDADYSMQWGLHGTYGIDVEKAWDISRGGNVRVGIFENGIDSTHDDLKGRIGGGNFTPASGTDLSHGTHVGGIISAVSNDKGIAGVSEATLFLLNRYSFVSSLQYAIDNDIRIINASFYYTREVNGITVPALPDSVHSQAIVNYGNFGGLLICSAGNDGNNSDDLPQYPSGYGDIRKYPNINNVISVGSIDISGDRSSYSNYGKNSVHIYAPGSSIYSTVPYSYNSTGYAYKSGTSMAAPHVTGVAALLLSRDPTLTSAELKEAILSGADDITISTPEGNQNVKKLNAYKALKSLPYKITFDKQGGQGGDDYVHATYGEDMPVAKAPIRYDYKFLGYYSDDGVLYYDYQMRSARVWDKFEDTTLTAKWEYDYYYVIVSAESYNIPSQRVDVFEAHFNKEYTLTAEEKRTAWSDLNQRDETRKFDGWYVILGTEADYDKDTNPWRLFSTDLTITFTLNDIVENFYDNFTDNGFVEFRKFYFDLESSGSCVSEGTLITLDNGQQVPVEQLTGDEMLLVWNLYTGTFDTAPILFIDSDPLEFYKVINLYFSDGTEVKVISEHGFWDFNLNKYVYLDENAAEYVGHWFHKQTTHENGEFSWTSVQLINVIIQEEYTTAWSPITYDNLCYYVNGMLSVPGGIEGLFNIFDVDSETLTYDSEAMAADIEQYGLFTYEEFAEILPVPEEIFSAFSGQYLKVAIGKGLIDFETLTSLVERYQNLF